MYELQWLAFRADLTRVVTFMLGRELNFRTYPEIGVTEGHHGLSHHQDRPEQIAKYAKVGVYQAELFGGFLEKLQSTPEGDGTLLDHSLLLYGAGLSNPNTHAHTDLPLLVVGGRDSRIEGNRHLVVPRPGADDQSAADAARQGRRSRRHARRQQWSYSGRHAGRRVAVTHDSACQNPNHDTSSTEAQTQCRHSLALLQSCVGRRVARRVLARRIAGQSRTLLDAAKAGDSRAARALLAKRADPNAVEADGTTALHWAVENDDAELTQALLAAGARAQVGEPSRRHPAPSALRPTATRRSSQRLIAAGADANGATPGGETPLMMAARTGDRGDGQGAARAWRCRRRAGGVARADGADVGGDREQRRGHSGVG